MIRKIILGVIMLIVLVIALNLVSQIMSAVKSGDRLSSAADIVYKLEVKNKQLQKKLTQIKSQEFIEEQARDKLGLTRKGETIVIIPEEKLKLILGASESAKPRFPNWLGWFKVFFK